MSLWVNTIGLSSREGTLHNYQVLQAWVATIHRAISCEWYGWSYSCELCCDLMLGSVGAVSMREVMWGAVLFVYWTTWVWMCFGGGYLVKQLRSQWPHNSSLCFHKIPLLSAAILSSCERRQHVFVTTLPFSPRLSVLHLSPSPVNPLINTNTGWHLFVLLIVSGCYVSCEHIH